MIAQNALILNPNQAKAAAAADRPLLIIAGAGTGKTSTLTMRIAHLLKNGVSPGKICALTFTNKAAKEISDRVFGSEALGRSARLPSFSPNTPFLGTFHSLGARILRKSAEKLGRTADFVIYDDQDGLRAMKKASVILGVPANKLRDRKKNGGGPAYFLDKISKIKNGMLAADLLEEECQDGALVAKAYEEYELTLKRSNAFDFDDLIEKVVRLFRNNPETLAEYRKRFTHFLVDEYQDINNMQYELIRLLAKNGNISVVGDDQQTIYSWRGSNFEIFLNFEKDWPDAQIVVLDQNYRSTQTIINASSALIGNNVRQKPKKLWTSNPPGEKISMVESLHEDEEAEWISEEIEKILTEKTPADAPYGDRGMAGIDKFSNNKNEIAKAPVAILYRTNAQSRAIEQALLAHGIQYSVYGGLKFYDRREIRDIIAALRFALNRKDEIARERLEKGITKSRFKKFEEALASAATSAPGAIIEIFLKSSGYIEHISKNLTGASDRVENIAELAEFASRFDSLSAMIEEVSLVQSTDAGNEKNKASYPVQLMTVHLAKGLEFDNVFIAGTTEGLLPHARSTGGRAELEEERRLMYVAMTRAKKRLFISFFDLPSRFISEIPEEYFEFTSLISGKKNFNEEESWISLD